ncbi:MAG: (2Fe-2S) ferredoxin domain-containing protein [Gallionella sp.]|jgi:(2Fe-2S) ferredoxin|nr:(2Fe-2S) ferredoxin domain-containing protein [Gallionella sp.]
MSDAVLEKPKMMQYKRHLLVCVGSRCSQNGASQALFDSLGEKFKAAGIDGGESRVKRSRTTCFATCKSGPILCVQPDGVWYYNVTPDNMDRIIQEHLVGGQPVEELIYHRGPSCDAA